MAETTIEWTATRLRNGTVLPGYTFNPWVGCMKISPACDHCYAEGWAKRAGNPELWTGERRRTSAQNWNLPRKWNREAEASGIRRKVFCASLADVFDNQVPKEWRHDLWNLISDTPQLDWLLLTKRPQNIAKMLPGGWARAPWPNVWLGTTVENQQEANRRIPHLLDVPAVILFLSCEPLLEQLSLTRIPVPLAGEGVVPHRPSEVNALTGELASFGIGTFVGQPIIRTANYPRLNWVICGGESGPKGGRCFGCGHYRGELPVCEYAPKAVEGTIPDDIMKESFEIAEALESNKSDALTCSDARHATLLTNDANAIARALMAERERCATTIAEQAKVIEVLRAVFSEVLDDAEHDLAVLIECSSKLELSPDGDVIPVGRTLDPDVAHEVSERKHRYSRARAAMEGE